MIYGALGNTLKMSSMKMFCNFSLFSAMFSFLFHSIFGNTYFCNFMEIGADNMYGKTIVPVLVSGKELMVVKFSLLVVVMMIKLLPIHL